MSERSLVEMIDRVRKEREEAFERAGLFARHADRLEKVLQSIIDDACCDEIAEVTNLALSEACRIFNEEWRVLHADKK